YTGWYDDKSVGGIEETLKKLTQADPSFVMGKVLCVGLELISTNTGIHVNAKLKQDLADLQVLASKSKITQREKLHVQAVNQFAHGDTTGACLVWEDILTADPTDMLALKLAHDSYFYLGFQPQMRDSIARVLPKWRPDLPLYSYLHGMYAFGLVETNCYQDAEKHALKGLKLNPRDCWSTHSQAHVLEMMGRQDEGIAFMSSTLDDWTVGEMLACHNFWHWAVYHVEKGEHDAALDIYDSQVGQRCKSGAMLDLVDASSLLYRLQMEGINVGNRWHELLSLWESHADDHILMFNDAHMLMCTLGAKNEGMTLKLMESLRNFVRDGKGHNREVSRDVGVAICEAFEMADKGDFAGAVELLKPVRYRIVNIGGSNAQVGLFEPC
ncbi:predicted protein, partial [Nematostella vectensis]